MLLKNDYIDVLNDENILLNAELLNVIWENNIDIGGLNIILVIRPQVKRFKGTIKLSFIQVQKAAFIFDGNYDLGYIERYKLFRLKNGQYYLSLDPYDEYSKEESDLDNYVLIFKKAERVIQE